MHVLFATSGGIAYFPGLARPVTIEADELPREDASELDGLVTDRADILARVLADSGQWPPRSASSRV